MSNRSLFRHIHDLCINKCAVSAVSLDSCQHLQTPATLRAGDLRKGRQAGNTPCLGAQSALWVGKTSDATHACIALLILPTLTALWALWRTMTRSSLESAEAPPCLFFWHHRRRQLGHAGHACGPPVQIRSYAGASSITIYSGIDKPSILDLISNKNEKVPSKEAEMPAPRCSHRRFERVRNNPRAKGN